MIPTSMFDDMQGAFLNLLGLRPLDEIAFNSDCTGVCRLLSLPPFEPFRAVTLEFTTDQVNAHLTISDDDAWERIATGNIVDSAVRIEKETALTGPALPAPLSNWAALVDSLRTVSDCMSSNESIGPHIHFAFGALEDSRYSWFNPDRTSNTQECKLIDAYNQISDAIE
ncbi:hypothetical protein Enr13x_67520 [Stieleria neptunia]|uniref:Uncharacterized protein n=1 Tax=Stieleria neptunia TaxID=2527979 RepID=A0A518I167_9BACT|nr:hypothetical protein [Stieleria neptunia]QDV46843.1 hypothetical protein Enr13x_67520 [Stieleria neptunia]